MGEGGLEPTLRLRGLPSVRPLLYASRVRTGEGRGRGLRADRGISMTRSATAAAALLLGLCAIFPMKAHAEEWRWCSAGDLLDSGRTNGPNLISRPFDAEGAPDFQAQYEAYVRSIMGPIEGEFMLNCSPPFADHDAAVRHVGEWSLSMHDMTGGLFEAEDVFWTPTYAASSTATADTPRSHDHATANDSATAASSQQATATVAAASVETQRSTEPTSPSSQSEQEDPARAEQRRQDWERKRFAQQQADATGTTDAGAAGAESGDPLKDLQGLWYATREKVTLEVKGNQIVVVENSSAKSWPNEQQFKPGLVLARLGPVQHQGSRVVWSGECWTNLKHDTCSEAASAFYEKRGKQPHWNLYIHAMAFVRKAQLAEWESSRE